MQDTHKTAPTFSFEFFPPRGDQAAASLNKAAATLVKTIPSFMTVTYGAGGNAQDGSLQTLKAFRRAHANVALGSHLTYIAATRDRLAAYSDELWQNGIKHIVALRGDAPKNMTRAEAMAKSEFGYTSDFVEWLKGRHDFEISVGAYPEKHPDAPSLAADIDALQKKCDAGADRAITQFFFENETYYRFLDEVQKKGITTPVVPGVLPIMNFTKTASFAAKCHSHVPDSLVARFTKYKDGSDDALKLAAEVLEEQVEDLLAQGVPHIHFYAMNSARILPAICKKIAAGDWPAARYQGASLSAPTQRLAGR